MYINHILNGITTHEMLSLAGPMPTMREKFLRQTIESIRAAKPKYGLKVDRDAVEEKELKPVLSCSAAALAGTEIIGLTPSDCPEEVLSRLLVKRVISRMEIYRKRKWEREQSDRKARREEKATGRTYVRNFAFLEGILAQTGHNKTSMARASGMTPQNVLHYFARDDAPLSSVKRMLKGIGINLEVGLESVTEHNPKDYVLVWDGERIAPWVSGQPRIEALVRSRIEKPSRVSFFARLLEYEGYPVTRFCELAGINNDRVRNILKTDDIRISEIYRLGSVFGHKVIWKVTTLC